MYLLFVYCLPVRFGQLRHDLFVAVIDPKGIDGADSAGFLQAFGVDVGRLALKAHQVLLVDSNDLGS